MKKKLRDRIHLLSKSKEADLNQIRAKFDRAQLPQKFGGDLTPEQSQAAMKEASTVAATISFTPQLPRIKVGARLRFFVLAWTTLVMDPWATSVVTHGYYPDTRAYEYRQSGTTVPVPCDGTVLVA